MADEIEMVRELGVVPDADDAVYQRAREVFLARVGTAPAPGEPSRRTRRTRRPRFAAAAVTVGVAAATAAALFVTGTATPLGISPAAAATLRQAATAASTAPGAPAGEYLYTRSHVSELELDQQTGSSPGAQAGGTTSGAQTSASTPDGGYQIGATEETWVDDAGSGRLLVTQTSISALPGGAGSAQPLPSLQRPLDLRFGATAEEAYTGVVNPANWPDRPGALLAAIQQRLGDGTAGSYSTFLSTTYLLSEVSDPGLRSACYQVLAVLPGLGNYGAVSDVLGRPGRAVGMTYDGIRTEDIVDPSTGALLEVENTVVAPGSSDVPAYRALPAGTVLDNKVITDQAVVSSDTARA